MSAVGVKEGAGGNVGKKSVKIRKVVDVTVKSPSPPSPAPSPPTPTIVVEEEEELVEEEEEEEEDLEGEWGEGVYLEGNDEEEEEEEDAGPPEPVFLCHEINTGRGTDLSNVINQGNNSVAASMDADALFPPSKYGVRYRMLDPDDLQYRPAALAEVNSKIAQFNGKRSNIVGRLLVQINSQLSQYGCHRIQQDKGKSTMIVPTTGGAAGGADERHIREGMDKLLTRLKIYKRVLSTLVIYFRAYAPLLFDIKKSYDDMLNFRIRQFKEAQHEKLRIYHDVSLVYSKMKEYQFPDYDKLMKGQQYLNLLMVRIQKQDEAIQCLTEILRKMEGALAEHYEQERDLQEQIRLLDHEREERMEKAAATVKKFEVPAEEEDNDAGADLIEGLDNAEGDEDEEQLSNVKMNEDQRMACILAYAVCLKDLEDAQKKLKIYEARYQNVAPRHEVETLKRKIQDEKAQTVELNLETDVMDGELLALRDEEIQVQNELEEYRAMPEDERLEAVRLRYARERREGGDEEEGPEHNSEEEDEDEEEHEGDEEGEAEGETAT